MTTAKKKTTKAPDRSNSMKDTRPTGAIVNALDGRKLVAAVNKMHKRNPEHGPSLLRVDYPVFGFYGKDGSIITCNSEGIGHKQSVESTVPVMLSYAMTPVVYDIPKELVLESVTGTTKDLSKVIRTFGDRLENNFHSLYYFYGKPLA